jgi:hypothetical protein
MAAHWTPAVDLQAAVHVEELKVAAWGFLEAGVGRAGGLSIIPTFPYIYMSLRDNTMSQRRPILFSFNYVLLDAQKE